MAKDITKKIEQKEIELQELINTFNTLENKKQELLKQALMLQGELKALKELN